MADAAVADKKAKTEYEEIAMNDGRTVNFSGKRQLDKTVTTDEESETAAVRFDFRNGDTYTLSSTDLSLATILQALGHGISQKVGDTTAGVSKVEDMSLAVSDMIDRLKRGEWAAAREAGDSFSGAGVVMRALVNVTGKPLDYIKEFLNKKLDAAKAAGQKLTRNDLYASFRDPSSKTGQEIARLEAEDRAKAAKVNASDLLAEIG